MATTNTTDKTNTVEKSIVKVNSILTGKDELSFAVLQTRIKDAMRKIDTTAKNLRE